MGHIHIAPVSEGPEPVLAAVRELGAETVILVGEDTEQVHEIERVLDPLGVETDHREPTGPMLLGTVQLVQRIVRDHPDREDDLIVNVGSADRYEACAFLSAAFVAGIRTIDREDDEITFLPVLRFSYDEVVGEEKLAILQALERFEDQSATLNQLANAADLSSSTVSYQVRGGQDTEGLEPLGLIEVVSAPGQDVQLRLTSMGELLSSGMRL